MDKITYSEYLRLAGNLNERDRFRQYSTVVAGNWSLDLRIVPNPDLVMMTAAEAELENAMQVGNDYERFNRRLQFQLDRVSQPDKPVIVSEGDSWFQFPLLIEDVIDQLNGDYAILSLGAAGDTASNMIFGPEQPRGREFLAALRSQSKFVKAFLFSGAGNDIIGEDPVTKKSSLYGILKPYKSGHSDPADHINEAAFVARMAALHAAYSKMIAAIRSDASLTTLPIILHGYDYAFPYPYSNNDKRSPIYAEKDQWLGRAFTDRGFPAGSLKEQNLRHEIVKVLIDRLYEMLIHLAGKSKFTNVYVVDCRGIMSDVNDWNDEIHGTSASFAKVAERFRKVLKTAGVP